MVSIHIDFSVFTPSAAVGIVFGEFEFQLIPRVGDTVSFQFPKNKDQLVAIPGFCYQLEVEHVIHSLMQGNPHVQLALSDCKLSTIEDAKMAISYFEQGFGLHA